MYFLIWCVWCLLPVSVFADCSFFPVRLGRPGVELTGMHDDISKVVQILPFASEVCVCVCVCVRVCT